MQAFSKSSDFHPNICFTFSCLDMHYFCLQLRNIICLSRTPSLWMYQQNLKTVSHFKTYHYSLRTNSLLLSSPDQEREYIFMNPMASDVLPLTIVFLLTCMHSIYAFALPRASQISISSESLVGHLPPNSSGRTDCRDSSSLQTSRNSTPGTKGVSCKNVSVSTLH